MSSFTQCLVVSKKPGSDLEWIVEKDFRYYIDDPDSSDFVEVLAGTETDLASVPMIRRVFRGDQAAVVHDVLYRRGVYHTFPRYEPVPISRELADKVFLQAMLVLGVGRWKARFYFRMVRMFAGRVWKGYRAEMAA